MRGRIIFVQPETKTGLIFGADRQRYDFELAEWQGSEALKRNQEVNFKVQGSHALSIVAYTADYIDEPEAAGRATGALWQNSTKPAAKEVPAAKTRLDPTLDDDIPSGLDSAFDDGIELPIGTGAADPEIAKPGSPRGVPLGPNILLDEGLGPKHPAWHYYLMGLGAFFVFILICYLLRPLFAHH